MNVVDGVSFRLSSDYVEASSLFTRNDSIFVYVESYKDISFWTNLFRNSKVRDRIKVFEISRDSKANGKSLIISMFREGTLILGERLLVALDSDYDYLLDNNSDIFSQDYCFQTYCYSIENFYFDPTDSLALCCQAANCFEFESQLRCLSDIFTQWSRENIEKFLRFLSTGEKTELEPIYQQLKNLSSETQLYKGTLVEISPRFVAKGLSHDNLFLFARGHDIESKCYQLLNAIFDQITHKKKQQIQNSTHHSQPTKRQMIAEFCQARNYIQSILYCRNISVNPFYEKISTDIEAFCAKYY